MQSLFPAYSGRKRIHARLCWFFFHTPSVRFFFLVLHGILGEEQLGGASADAQSYWQGRFAACTFVGGFLGIGRTRNSWGVAPNPTRDAVP